MKAPGVVTTLSNSNFKRLTSSSSESGLTIDDQMSLPSVGAGFLLKLAREFRERDGRVVLASVQARVRATLETLGLDGVLRTYEDPTAARAALAS